MPEAEHGGVLVCLHTGHGSVGGCLGTSPLGAAILGPTLNQHLGLVAQLPKLHYSHLKPLLELQTGVFSTEVMPLNFRKTELRPDYGSL